MSLVEFERSADGVGTITLNDPDNLNAMGEDMAREFTALVERLRPDSSSLSCIILTGAGRAFSAGGDLEMLDRKRGLEGEKNRQLMLSFYGSFLGILKLNVPLIAAINGHAIGAGLCVASACDIRIAAEKAKLGFTFTRLGLHPGMGATYFLPRLLGVGTAMELLLTGRIVEAPEAARIGLISKVVSQESVIKEAQAIAAEIGECGPESVRQVLESVRAGAASLSHALEREALCQSINYKSAEFAEGVRAAIEKRKPQFPQSK